MKRVFFLFLILGLFFMREYEKKREKKNLIARCIQQADSHLKFPHPIEDRHLELLQTPFLYLGKGKQAVAFTSLNGEYVLKLLHLPKKREKRALLFQSLQIAITELSDETGVIGVQYGPYLHKNNRDISITLFNKKGKKELIYLNHSPFILQRRAPFHLKETLFRLEWEKDIDSGKSIIQALFSLLRSQRIKGVIDLDGALIRNGNIALISENGKYTAITIDIGRFAKALPSEITTHDIKRLKPLKSWIGAVWPDLLKAYLQEEKSYIEDS